MPKLRLYTTEECPHCNSAEAWLRQQGLLFQVCDMSEHDIYAQVLFKGTGRDRAAPTLRIGNSENPQRDRWLVGWSMDRWHRAILQAQHAEGET